MIERSFDRGGYAPTGEYFDSTHVEDYIKSWRDPGDRFAKIFNVKLHSFDPMFSFMCGNRSIQLPVEFVLNVLKVVDTLK